LLHRQRSGRRRASDGAACALLDARVSGADARRVALPSISKVARAAAAACLLVAGLTVVPALACSPAAYPTVTGLPDGAVVIVGTTGDVVEGGRLFYVERVYAGSIDSSPIVIAFKEGEPIGDCSYPMTSGVRLLIAPAVGADGTLRADLATLQADPASEDGHRFIEEAEARYGQGTVPEGATAPGSGGGSMFPLAVLVAGLAAALTIALARGGRGSTRRPPAR
jgi:hypothetical protein